MNFIKRAMKKVIVFVCISSLIGNIYGSDPILSKSEFITGKCQRGLSFLRTMGDVDYSYGSWGFSINASLGYSNIINNNLQGELAPQGGSGYSIGASYFHALGPYLTLFAGADVSSISAKIEPGDGFEADYSTMDIDNVKYTESIRLYSQEKISPTYISVPVIFEIGNPNVDKMGFYLDLGIKFSYLISSGYEKTGEYTSRGIYPDYGVTLEDIPELGFYGDLRGESDQSRAEFDPLIELNKMNISLQGGVGITLPISSSVIFKGGLVTYYGLTDISNPPSEPDSPNIESENNEALTNDAFFKRSKYIDNSFATNEGSRTLYLGVEIGIYIVRRLN